MPLPQESSDTEFDKYSGLGANFITHLIAMRDRAPQVLKRQRASTDEAIASYEHAAPRDDSTIPIKDS